MPTEPPLFFGDDARWVICYPIEKIVELQAGEACIVPQGVWHRLLVRAPGELLFRARSQGRIWKDFSAHEAK